MSVYYSRFEWFFCNLKKSISQLGIMLGCIWHRYVDLVWNWLMHVTWCDIAYKQYSSAAHNKIPSRNVRIPHNDLKFYWHFCVPFENAQAFFLPSCFVCVSVCDKNLPPITCNCGENFIGTSFDLCMCAVCVCYSALNRKNGNAIKACMPSHHHNKFPNIRYSSW